mmetsp:Transcript_14917/g.27155  ORF Transcript_14917/g.27155 Transcript_14917/m.27155 type:complete len:968 (-) Transcript_14917:187-3090(-)
MSEEPTQRSRRSRPPKNILSGSGKSLEEEPGRGETIGQVDRLPRQPKPRIAKHGFRPGGSTHNIARDKSDDDVRTQKEQIKIDSEMKNPVAKIEDPPMNPVMDNSVSIRNGSIFEGGMKKSNERNPEHSKYSGNAGRTNNSKKNPNHQQQQKPIQELKINSRASLWMNKGSNHHRSPGSRMPDGGSQARANEVWAAARAERMKNEEQFEKENNTEDNWTGPIAAVKVADQKKPSRSTRKQPNNPGGHKSIATESREQSSYSLRPDRSHTYGQSNAIRKEWEKIDNNHAKSPMEEHMDRLLASLNDADVGMLSSLSAQLPIELPDGEGGSVTSIQEQILADAAGKIMDRWVYHQKWNKDEAKLAGQILLRMEIEEVLADGAQVPKDIYLSVINAYAKCTAEDETASMRADNLLDHMEKRAREGRLDLKPDRLLINTVMGAQAKHALSGTLNLSSISASERMLDTLEREYASGDKTMQPTSRTYSKFIDLYAKNGRADDAALVLKRMETQYRNGNKAALPRTIHYTSVIDAFAKSAGSSSRAEEVLRSMLNLYDNGNLHLAPDTVVFSATIDAYSKSKRADAAERVLNILDLMDKYDIAPDIVTYNIVLNTLSHDPNYLCEAKAILQFIEQSGLLRADSFTYNAVVKSCPPEDAEALIQHWEMEFKLGHTDERPDSYTYCSLIKSWTTTNRIGYEDKCVKILHWMEENEVVGMNRIVYNEVMKAFSRSTRKDAGDLAEGVFHQLEARYTRTQNRDMRPDRFSFMALLNAFSRSCKSHRCAVKAEGVLFTMMDSNYRPDSKLCNNVISAWARSGSNDAAARAEAVCDRMDLLGIEIDGVVFNSLINVHVKSRNSRMALNALKVFERMHERNVLPTSVTYTLLFQACLGDEECLLQVFESCIKHGMLDQRLQSSFREHGPACIKDQLSGKIPYVWSQFANRGPGGPSRGQIKGQMKRGSTGADVRRFGWAR